MFERSIQLRRAEKALAEGRWEEALSLASDPRIAAHRRGLAVAARAREALLDRARKRADGGDPAGARRDLDRAGGDATLAGLIEGREQEALRQGLEVRRRLARLRSLLQAGRPACVLAELERCGPASEEHDSLVEAARAAQVEAVQIQARLRQALAARDLGRARSELDRLASLDRDQPGFEALQGEVLRASFLDSLQELAALDPARAWSGLASLIAGEPRLLELSEARALLEEMGQALAGKAESLLAAGDAPAARPLLELFELPGAFGQGPAQAPLLGAWAEALELADKGRREEACALAMGLSRALPGAGRWARDQEPGPAEGPLAAWTWRFEGSAALEGLASRGAHPAWAEARQSLAREEARGLAALEEAAALLETGRPGAALAVLARGGPASSRAAATELCQQAAERIQAAGRALGEWRAGLALLARPEELGGLDDALARAAAADREAPGLQEALEHQARLPRTMEALAQARGALDSLDGPAGRAALALQVPEGARGLRAEHARLLGEAARLGKSTEGDQAPRKISVPAGRTGRGGFILRVAGAGDLLVLPKDRLLVGSVANPAADLGLLARLGREHAELRRTLRFHRGAEHHLRAVEGQEVTLGGEPVQERVLEPGDLIGLGPAVRLRYLRPVPSSATPLLFLEGEFEAEGCRRVAWLKCPGWDGALRLGPEAESHLRAAGATGRLEFALDRQNRLLARGSAPLTIDGSPAGQEGVVALGQEVRCGSLVVFVDARRRGPGAESRGAAE